MQPLYLGLALGAGFLLYLSVPKEASKKEGGLEFGACLDDNMSPEERLTNNEILSQPFDDESGYVTLIFMAEMADNDEMPIFAACLREKARKLKNR